MRIEREVEVAARIATWERAHAPAFAGQWAYLLDGGDDLNPWAWTVGYTSEAAATVAAEAEAAAALAEGGGT